MLLIFLFKINDVKKLARFYYALYVRASKNSHCLTNLIGVNMKTNHLSYDDMFNACRELESGRHGSFAQHIARAYVVADKGNSQKLSDAFPDLFERGHHFAQSRKLQQL